MWELEDFSSFLSAKSSARSMASTSRNFHGLPCGLFFPNLSHIVNFHRLLIHLSSVCSCLTPSSLVFIQKSFSILIRSPFYPFMSLCGFTILLKFSSDFLIFPTSPSAPLHSCSLGCQSAPCVHALSSSVTFGIIFCFLGLKCFSWMNHSYSSL